MVAMVGLPKPAAATTSPAPLLPVPMPTAVQSALESATLVNPIKLTSAPKPVLAPLSEELELSRPVVAHQPRKHYVVNAGSSTDLDALFPIKPAAATVPVR
jgi:hypothetical protein